MTACQTGQWINDEFQTALNYSRASKSDKNGQTLASINFPDVSKHYALHSSFLSLCSQHARVKCLLYVYRMTWQRNYILSTRYKYILTCFLRVGQTVFFFFTHCSSSLLTVRKCVCHFYTYWRHSCTASVLANALSFRRVIYFKYIDSKWWEWETSLLETKCRDSRGWSCYDPVHFILWNGVIVLHQHSEWRRVWKALTLSMQY